MVSAPPRTILMIEDNPFDAQILRDALQHIGEPCELNVIEDPLRALQFFDEFQPGDSRPCLIILDLHFPRVDGATILRSLRAHPLLRDVPVAALPSLASPSEQRAVMDLGVDLYRTKPIGWEETLQLASELISLCRRGIRS
ncbi:MAG TPA: response regulator [Bryobacteraceae bacterium]